MTPSLRICAALAIFSVLPLAPQPATAQTTITAFTLDSEPLEYIGQGQSQVFAPPNAQFSAEITQNSVSLTTRRDGRSYTATVVAPEDEVFVPGETYNAADAPDERYAGLDVSGDGRQCAETEGLVTIHRIIATPVIQEFAASYLQVCNGRGGFLYGELRYNTSVGYKAAWAAPEAAFTSESPTRDIALENRGSDPIQVEEVRLLYREGSNFAIESDGCSGTSIPAGSSCSVVVRYDIEGRGYPVNALLFREDTFRGGRHVRLFGPGATPGDEDTPSTGNRRTVTKTRLFGEYARRGKYELFHLREGVLQAGFLFPRTAGKRLNFEIQIRQGGWREFATESFRVRRGVAGAVFGAGRGTYRANNSFEGNSKFAPSRSAWQYFKITA